ncbi:DNA sulfur modification protein DndB [Corallococcus sp. CA047B]|uniref:DNA sulfur modification protein DndB n=1 Tax=Corallococcus sp. CA047B TaxID=2316729 RepID=UPI0013153D9C|nr:DNA sulfur modification protein DndB [Corallococcus sp. CA047B]
MVKQAKQSKSNVVSATVVHDVYDYVDRPGIGRIYRAKVSVRTLATLLRKAVVRYSPKYQRGFKKVEDEPLAYEVMLPITDPRLQINVKRAEEIAVKYLQEDLFSDSIVWNARIEDGFSEPEWDNETKELRIHTSITIPDSAHRHLAYYLLDTWANNPVSVPDVTVNDRIVAADEIRKRLKGFDPDSASVFVHIYHVTAKWEGWLYDQLNFDQKAPQRAVGIALNPTKTPARRFVDTLMRSSPVFSDTEVETRANNIGTDSRKLTTNSTLVGAVESFKPFLVQLEDEEEKTGAYTDFVEFVGALFEEYSAHVPAVQPNATAQTRNESRKNSFEISNIMFHPLLRLAKELWGAYRRDQVDWRIATEWKDGVARIAGAKTINGQVYKVMSRENPEWIGKILIEQYDSNGKKLAPSLSNTRQTRQAALDYLVDIAGIRSFLSGKSKAKAHAKKSPIRRGRKSVSAHAGAKRARA